VLLDFDRRQAAAALNIHPNALDYRLRRVHELTGLSLSTAHGLLVLGAAQLVAQPGQVGGVGRAPAMSAR
jgi:sugar diacid utilization regulator